MESKRKTLNILVIVTTVFFLVSASLVFAQTLSTQREIPQEERLNINLVGDITLVNDVVHGDGLPIELPRRDLYEGESIIFVEGE